MTVKQMHINQQFTNSNKHRSILSDTVETTVHNRLLENKYANITLNKKKGMFWEQLE